MVGRCPMVSNAIFAALLESLCMGLGQWEHNSRMGSFSQGWEEKD